MSTPTPDDLRAITILADLPEPDLAWIAERSEMVELEPGGELFKPGDPAAWMYLLVEGTLHTRRAALGPTAPVWVVRRGEVTGMLPFSRMTEFAGTSRAVTRARVARFPAQRFPELLARIPVLEQRLIGVLADRVRESTRLDQQQDKLAALGKLSAGLAHELNNPASAVRRSAAELRTRMGTLNQFTVALVQAGAGLDAVRALDAARAALAGRASSAPADPIARADLEDALAEWLGKVGVKEPWVQAATFVEAGLDVDRLSAAVEPVPPPARASAIAWLEAALAIDALLDGLVHASGRIVELVGAVKTYTRMDQSRGKEEVDVRVGLDSTLAMFGHRLKEKHVTVTRDYDEGLPAVPGYAGELNQVWTNLIDNAIDAAPAGGHVHIRAVRDGGAVRVDVRDDGAGIPRQLLDRIWEPFFTTKEVGQGTGLGLEIARRIVSRHHGGDIQVESVPGNTTFTVRLPLISAPAQSGPQIDADERGAGKSDLAADARG